VARLLAVLRDTDPERPCWNFVHGAGTAAFWTRRQTLEAAIHRWDAEEAIGAPLGFPEAVAVAGISEVVDDLFPRQVALARTAPLSAPVRLRAIDLAREWTLASERRLVSADMVAEVAGPADALLLLLWRRTDLDDPSLVVRNHPDGGAELRSTLFAP
jgi:uncharacterized protein (TIGR03083 family)